MFVVMFCVVVGVVGIVVVVQVVVWCFKQVVDCVLVYVVWQYVSGFLVCWEGDQCGVIECIECMDFNVFDFYDIVRFYDDIVCFWYVLIDLQVDVGFWVDKWYIGWVVLYDGGGDVDVNMIVVIVGCEDCVNLVNGEWIQYEWCGVQVRL